MKTIRLISLLLVLGAFGNLSAAYLEYIPQQITQPNGTVLNCFASGDEYYHWLHDSNGFTIIQNVQTGFFVYADKSGEELIPTALLPGVDNPSSAGLRPRLNISQDRYRQLFNARFKDPQFKSGRSYSNTGAYNNLVIFIRFTGQNEYSESLNVYSSAFNGSGVVSMNEYFKEVSKAQLNISSTFYPTPSGTTIVSYQDSHTRRYYQPYSASNTEGYRTETDYINREMTLLKNAAEFVRAQVEASGIDYDYDNDGKIDNVCFIIQGKTDGWSDLLWPHRWVLYQYDVRIGGARVYDFNFQLSEALGVSVLCHEMFHSLGAPDLYRYENDDITPVGPWDLMAHNKTPPQHMSAYMKMKYGKWFSQIPTITASGTYTLKPLSSDGYAAYKIPSPNSTTEFFVLEYRKAAGRFESSLVGTGLIIYRINQSLEGNAQGPPDEVYVYRPNGNNRSNGNINAAPYSSNLGRTEFSDQTSPSCFLSTGAAGGIKISNIGTAGETISFTVGSGGAFNPPHSLTATLTGRNVNLNWQKPEPGNGTLDAYKVYRNQVLIGTITNPGTLTYTDTNLSDGTYNYYVTARYVTPAGESAGSNTVTVSVGGGDKPDLVINNPFITPVNVESGDLVSLTCKLENKGAVRAGISMLRVYLSLDEIFDSEDRQLAEGSMGALEAGVSLDVAGDNIPVPGSVSNGKWFVLFIADADGAVGESIENNNQASTTITIGNPALNPPRSLVAQVDQLSVKLSWLEPEPGGGTLAGFAVYRNGARISSINNPGVLEFTDPALSLGTYTYHITANYSEPLGESAKSNEVTVTVTNEVKPDLTIQDFDITPKSAAPGGSIDISCTLLNIGGSQAPANQVDLYLSKDLVIDATDVYLAYGTMDPLDAGDNFSVTGEDISLPDDLASGTWYALIMCDALGVISESNENNNLASTTLIVQGESPDLQIVNITFFPFVITPNTNVRVNSIIYNGGTVLASTVKITVFLSSDEVLDPSDKKLFDESTRTLGSKGTISLSGGFTIQPSYLPGQYFLIGVVDKDNTINESDETNNQLIKPVIVSGTSGTGDEPLSGSLSLFPVPAKDKLNIQIGEEPGQTAVIQIIDILGKTVYRLDFITTMSDHVEVNVTTWEKGMYLVRYQTTGKSIARKILIE